MPLLDRKSKFLFHSVTAAETHEYSTYLPMSRLYGLDVWGPYLENYPFDERPRSVNKEGIMLVWFDPNIVMDKDQLLKRLRTINDFSLIYSDLDDCMRSSKAMNLDKIIFVTTCDAASQLVQDSSNLNILDSIFIYDAKSTVVPTTLINYAKNQLFNDMIHQLPHDRSAKQQMIDACRNYYRGNSTVLNKIEEFETTYEVDDCIRWYTKDTFVYKLINKALRTKDVEQLYVFRYYITDLSKSLNREFHRLRTMTNSLTVYRGATMSSDEFHELKSSVGLLISTNSYFSTSRSRSIAEIYTGSNDSAIKGVLFEIECDLCKNIVVADVSSSSEIYDELECLFDLGSTFEIISIEPNNQYSSYYVVKLRATDEQRSILDDFIRQSRKDVEDESLPVVFGALLNNMGLYAKSIRYFKNLLQNYSDKNVSRIHFHLADAYDNDEKYDLALQHLEISYKIIKNRTSKGGRKQITYVWLYKGIVLNHMKRFKQSLFYSNKALKSLKQIYGHINHRDIASCLFSIGQSYFGLSNFGCDKSISAQNYLRKSLGYQRQVLTMQQACLPADHSDIAITLGELSNLFYFTQEYDASLKVNKMSLDIQQRYLPSNHLAISTSLRNVATIYYELGDLDNALDYFQQCLTIQQDRLPLDHIEIARTERNIAQIFGDKGETDKALQHLREGLPLDWFDENTMKNLYDPLNM
ncbi:unnamed protein product [Rotaria magnacalcarata]|nr:unnamed protein product [Rotaria magnacalcarata]CAF4205738.1 unnamed protein product [Rotaria magnacalcarata]